MKKIKGNHVIYFRFLMLYVINTRKFFQANFIVTALGLQIFKILLLLFEQWNNIIWNYNSCNMYVLTICYKTTGLRNDAENKDTTVLSGTGDRLYLIRQNHLVRDFLGGCTLFQLDFQLTCLMRGCCQNKNFISLNHKGL